MISFKSKKFITLFWRVFSANLTIKDMLYIYNLNKMKKGLYWQNSTSVMKYVNVKSNEDATENS